MNPLPLRESMRSVKYRGFSANTNLSGNVVAAAGKVGGGFKSDTTVTPPNIRTFKRIRRLSKREKLRRPFILCLDEIQNIQSNTPAAELVRGAIARFEYESIAPAL